MNTTKKILAGALAAVTVAGAAVAMTGCSGSSWAMKSENGVALPAGVYRYALFYQYQNAMYSVTDYTKPILSQEIEGEPAADWIRQKALDYVKPFLLIEDKMKELNLQLSDVAKYNAEQYALADWQNYGSMFEDYGISRTDLQYANYDYAAKFSRVFEALYGEGGEKEVPEKNLHKYFLKKYTDIDYILAETTEADGSVMEDAEIKALEKEMNTYAKQFNAGKKTLEEIANAYGDSVEGTTADDTEGHNHADEYLHSATTEMNASKGYTDDMIKSINKMDNEKAQVLNLSENGYIMLVVKHDIADAEEAFFDKDSEDYENNIFGLLVDMRGEEYQKEMQELAENYDESKITYNDAEFNVDLAALFEPDSITSEDGTASEAEPADTNSKDADKEETTSAE